MRGLQVFISDIRAARSREEEEKRINKEKANILSHFKDAKLSSYDKKKYVCKLLYMYMLGWDVDFGHVEAFKLVTGTTYTEKQIGYLSVTLLLTEQSDLVRIVVNSIRQDLTSNNEVFICLALAAVASVGGREMSEALATDVQKLLFASTMKNAIKKKAALCLLRLYRKNPDVLPASDWSDRILTLLDDNDQGVVNSAASLVLALVQDYPNEYAGCVPKAVSRLGKLGQSDGGGDYDYYNTPNPWLQVKLLRLLQYYPPPSDSVRQNLDKLLYTIINKAVSEPSDSTRSFNANNAANAVVFEAINLAVHLDPDTDLVKRCTTLLGKFISHKESNLRYLGLGAMATVATSVESLDGVKQHTDTILQALRDRDISVRRQALDLLYSMCDSTNSKRIVAELLNYLGIADYAIREELVLKIAILAERFATEYSWYVDVILQLISIAGDHVSEEVWYRVVQIVTNHPNLQQYAAKTVFQALNSPTWHETAVKVAGYILGEFGDYIANDAGSSPKEQFQTLHSKFPACSLGTRALLLSSYVKLLNLFPEIRDEVERVFKQYSTVLDVEVQQRAAEYLAIANAPANLLEIVCEEMPPYDNNKESGLVSLVKKKEGETTDKRVRPRDRDQQREQRPKTKLTNFGGGGGGAPTRPVEESRTAPKKSPTPSAPSPQPTRTQSTQSAPADDLIGGSGISSAPRSQAAVLEDLLGLGSNVSAPASASGVTPGSERWFLQLLVRTDGVLFEDEQIQIGIKSEYKPPSARLALYFGNKSPQSPFNNFSVATAPTQGLSFQVQQAAPQQLPPATQNVHILLVNCDAEFPEAPLIAISYVIGNTPRRLVLRLPLTVARFVMPVQLNATDFFARWKQIGSEGQRESIKDIRTSPNATGDFARQVLTAFQLSVLDGVDPNPSNFVAAGIFASGNGTKAGCLVRVQSNTPSDQLTRVTVRSTSTVVASALANYLSMRLSA